MKTLLAVLSLLAAPAFADTFLYANFSGYSTTLIANNPSDTPIQFKGLYPDFEIFAPVVGARSTFRLADWPEAGGGIKDISVPEGLQVYVEVKDPHGKIARIKALTPTLPEGTAQLQDLLTTGEFKSFIFIASSDGSAITLVASADSQQFQTSDGALKAGEVQILEAPSGANRIEVISGWPQFRSQKGTLYVVGLISHQPNGELLVVYP